MLTKKPKRRKFSATTRRKAMKIAGYRCQRCGETSKLTLHHVNGRSDNRLSSAMVLCETCHFWKHHTTKRHHKPKRSGRLRRPGQDHAAASPLTANSAQETRREAVRA
jgi:hypothetical protein